MIALTPKDVDGALEKAGDGIAAYCQLQARFQECNPCEDGGFQKAFNHYYRVRRGGDWRQAFYEIMQQSKGAGAKFDQTLHRLLVRTGRLEASFTSKLVATIDPMKPVIDQYVLGCFNLRLPNSTAKHRESKIVAIYEELCALYHALLASEQGATICEQFDRRYPDVRVTDLKKVDFVLWQIRPSPQVGRTK